ncbi:hypothetical protein NK8_57800 (plasmid) [Caballeronia sp. NK8]|nr:hypothetical protein NK8_57800 [Caballeronia sp. NK8]
MAPEGDLGPPGEDATGSVQVVEAQHIVIGRFVRETDVCIGRFAAVTLSELHVDRAERTDEEAIGHSPACQCVAEP